MFNLLMFNVDWVSGRVTVPMGRMLEYTGDQIAAKFQNNSGNIPLDNLTALPCFFVKKAQLMRRPMLEKSIGYKLQGGTYR